MPTKKINGFNNSSIGDKDTQITEGQSMNSPIRILKNNNQRAEF